MISCVCFINLAAASAPRSAGWKDLLTDKVVACGVAAVALLILSLLLRGLLKVITLSLVVVLAAGAFWFLRDGIGAHGEVLPREWTSLAERTLDSEKARDAWASVKADLAHLSKSAREHLAAGTDSARKNVQARIEAKARELRKGGSAAEADQLARFAEMIGKQK